MSAPLLGVNLDHGDTGPAELLELGPEDDTVLDGEVVTVSVLFADLRGFTSAAEHVGAPPHGQLPQRLPC